MLFNSFEFIVIFLPITFYLYFYLKKILDEFLQYYYLQGYFQIKQPRRILRFKKIRKYK